MVSSCRVRISLCRYRLIPAVLRFLRNTILSVAYGLVIYEPLIIAGWALGSRGKEEGTKRCKGGRVQGNFDEHGHRYASGTSRSERWN